MFETDEVVRVLTGAIMEILPGGATVRVPKSDLGGPPEHESFCVQIDARSADEYKVRVVPLTEKQKRQLAGRTEEQLKLRLDPGWTIKVWHYRMTEFGTLCSKWQAKRYGYKLAAKGGFTEVEVTSPDGIRTFRGTAICSPYDAYCRAEGRVIALDRAVAAYEAEGFPPMALLIEGGYPDGFGGAAGAQS